MTERRYTGSSVEDLLHDQEFVSAVKKINTTGEWEQFLRDHPGSNSAVNQAREIILLFQTSERTLDEERKQKLWSRIYQYNSHSGNDKSIQLKIFARIAAAVLIILSLGGLFYFQFNGDQRKLDHYQFSRSENGLKSDEPLLVLSNGTKVGLKKTESKITVLKDQDAIQINNDSIVNTQLSAEKKSGLIKFNEVIIPFGKKSRLVLADGTTVWLNAGSRFAFPSKFAGKKRNVILDGEAYFEVVKNTNQPFTVSTGDITIEVLGTKFNVNAYSLDDFSETVLLEGSVNIWDNSQFFKDKVLMTPSQKATHDKTGKGIVLKTETEPGKAIAWVSGWYKFTNERLEEVLKKLEKYYNVKFEYDQSIISRALPISGKLDLKDSLEEVLVVLSRVAKFEYQMSGKVITIKIKKSL